MTKPIPDNEQHEKDPRTELGLKSPVRDKAPQGNRKTDDRASDQGQKATRFDGNPNPQAADSSPLKPKDDTPMRLKKVDGPEADQ